MIRYIMIGEDIPDTRLTAEQAAEFINPLPEVNGKYALDDDYYLIVEGGNPRQPEPAPERPETFADFNENPLDLLPDTGRPSGAQMGTAEIIGIVCERSDFDGRRGYATAPEWDAVRKSAREWESAHSVYTLRGVYGTPILCNKQCSWRGCQGVMRGQPCCKQTLFRESSPVIYAPEEEEELRCIEEHSRRAAEFRKKLDDELRAKTIGG